MDLSCELQKSPAEFLDAVLDFGQVLFSRGKHDARDVAFFGLVAVDGFLGKFYRVPVEVADRAALDLAAGRKYLVGDVPAAVAVRCDLLMEHLVQKGKYKNLLMTLTDSADEIVKTILEFREK